MSWRDFLVYCGRLFAACTCATSGWWVTLPSFRDLRRFLAQFFRDTGRYKKIFCVLISVTFNFGFRGSLFYALPDFLSFPWAHLVHERCQGSLTDEPLTAWTVRGAMCISFFFFVVSSDAFFFSIFVLFQTCMGAVHWTLWGSNRGGDKVVNFFCFALPFQLAAFRNLLVCHLRAMLQFYCSWTPFYCFYVPFPNPVTVRFIYCKPYLH